MVVPRSLVVTRSRVADRVVDDPSVETPMSILRPSGHKKAVKSNSVRFQEAELHDMIPDEQDILSQHGLPKTALWH